MARRYVIAQHLYIYTTVHVRRHTLMYIIFIVYNKYLYDLRCSVCAGVRFAPRRYDLQYETTILLLLLLHKTTGIRVRQSSTQTPSLHRYNTTTAQVAWDGHGGGVDGVVAPSTGAAHRTRPLAPGTAHRSAVRPMGGGALLLALSPPFVNRRTTPALAPQAEAVFFSCGGVWCGVVVSRTGTRIII